MAVHIPQPTPYQDVSVFLNLVLSTMRTILREHFIGLYLGGSLVLGDFNPPPWGQQAIGQQWTALIEWALAWPHATESNHLAATLGLRLPRRHLGDALRLDASTVGRRAQRKVRKQTKEKWSRSEFRSSTPFMAVRRIDYEPSLDRKEVQPCHPTTLR